MERNSKTNVLISSINAQSRPQIKSKTGKDALFGSLEKYTMMRKRFFDFESLEGKYEWILKSPDWSKHLQGQFANRGYHFPFHLLPKWMNPLLCQGAAYFAFISTSSKISAELNSDVLKLLPFQASGSVCLFLIQLPVKVPRR